MLRVLAACLVIFTVACAGATAPRSSGVIITPSDSIAAPAWTDEERKKGVVVRNLRRTSEASFHLLRVGGQQPSYMHERSDLVLFVVAGKINLVLGDQKVAVGPGDVIEVPRGTPYQVQNDHSQASVAYMAYTPALDPNDRKPGSAQPTRESVWKWNLWVQ